MSEKIGFEYFDKEVKKRRKEIVKLEDDLEEKKEAYRKLLFQKISWEYNMMVQIQKSQSLTV